MYISKSQYTQQSVTESAARQRHGINAKSNSGPLIHAKEDKDDRQFQNDKPSGIVKRSTYEIEALASDSQHTSTRNTTHRPAAEETAATYSTGSTGAEIQLATTARFGLNSGGYNQINNNESDAIRGRLVDEEQDSHRAQQAIAAYNSHQHFDERNHFTRVMGIDEYV